MAHLLDEMDQTLLPRTILYCLNPRDNEMMATMIGNFQVSGKFSLVLVGGSTIRKIWHATPVVGQIHQTVPWLPVVGMLGPNIVSFLSYTLRILPQNSV
ncbi:glucuronate isomerase [Vibrio lentus]|nr:glucuronate isomerase [Vibrio lentus]